MNLLMAPVWSPYLAGAGIGVLLWCAFLLSGRPIGCSSAFSRTAGMIQGIFQRKKVAQSEYYQELPPRIEWQWMLVTGIIAGSFLSSLLAGTFHLQMVPDAFAAVFGTDPFFRLLIAITGGVLMGIGARWAWGCTSGHGISGLAQLSVASIVAVCCFFIGGIITAALLFLPR